MNNFHFTILVLILLLSTEVVYSVEKNGGTPVIVDQFGGQINQNK